MGEDEVAAIRSLIAAGDEDAAFSRLLAGFGWPRGRALPASELPRWVELIVLFAERRGAPGLAEVAAAVVQDPMSPDQLYELGYALIDAGAPAMAASVLWHCLALVGDSEEVVCELVSALECALAYEDALEVLEQHAALRQRSFLCRYLYGFNAAMAGQLDKTRGVLPQLEAGSEESAGLRRTLAGIVERADHVRGACPLDARDLRGWHYVLTGGLLTHVSPYGFDEPMRGRYAWLADSLPRLATGIDRLVQLVAPLDLPCVYAPEGRGHAIVAQAVASRLGLTVAPWPVVGVPAPGLVVLYDLADLPPEAVPQLVQRRPGQVLFAHASPWTVDSPIAPDVTTLLYQSLVPPWGPSMVVDPETRAVSNAAPDERDVSAIVSDLLASPGLDETDLTADQPEAWAALVARAWPPSPGPRSRLWAGGPVPSSRFL
jgi:hypothetical protein